MEILLAGQAKANAYIASTPVQTRKNAKCTSMWEQNHAVMRRNIWSSLHTVTVKRWTVYSISLLHHQLTSSPKCFVTTGQLSLPSGGLCSTVCNLIAVTVQCTGKESFQHGRHLCICYGLRWLQAVPCKESRASGKQQYFSPYIIMEPTGRAKSLHGGA